MPVGAKGIVLTHRDQQVLLGLLDARVMKTSQVSELYFERRMEAAYKRLQKLKAEGYVGERTRRAAEPAVVWLTKKGYRSLLQHGMLSGYPQLSEAAFDKRSRVSDLTIAHELAVVDLKVAMARSVERQTTLTLQ